MDVLRRQLGVTGNVPLHAPVFTGNERRYVLDCLDTGWVSSVGSYVDRFEEMTAAVAGTKFAIATVNGTAALHVALHALGVGPGHYVLCPTLTFIATANAITYCGATPLFVDSALDTLGMDAVKLRSFLSSQCVMRDGHCYWNGRPIVAALPVHIFGQPVDMDPLNQLCAEYGIAVIEDSTEALGSSYRGRSCGSLARLGTFSFNGNKIITTGGGGMVVTDDEALAQKLKHLTTTARVPAGWEFQHDEIGYNYRLPNLNAALGCGQLERLDRYLAAKRRLHDLYRDAFAGAEGVRLVESVDGSQSNYWLCALMFKDKQARNEFLAMTNEQGIQTRPCWQLMHQSLAYANAPCAGGMETAESIADQLVNIPSSPWLVDRGLADV